MNFLELATPALLVEEFEIRAGNCQLTRCGEGELVNLVTDSCEWISSVISVPARSDCRFSNAGTDCPYSSGTICRKCKRLSVSVYRLHFDEHLLCVVGHLVVAVNSAECHRFLVLGDGEEVRIDIPVLNAHDIAEFHGLSLSVFGGGNDICASRRGDREFHQVSLDGVSSGYAGSERNEFLRGRGQAGAVPSEGNGLTIIEFR